MMRYVYLVIKIVILLFLLLISVKNIHSVDFFWFFGNTVQWPLIVLLLIFLALGILLGILGMTGRILRLRREISCLKKENKQKNITVIEDPSEAVGE